MEHYDSDKAARVWQRVRGDAPAPETPGLPAFLAAEMQLQGLYRKLAKPHPAAAELARDCARHAAMLRGICACTGTPRPQHQIDAYPSRNVLQLCYGKTLQAIADYEKQAAHPEYGCAMAAMAQKKREHACRILELIGNTQSK